MSRTLGAPGELDAAILLAGAGAAALARSALGIAPGLAAAPAILLDLAERWKVGGTELEASLAGGCVREVARFVAADGWSRLVEDEDDALLYFVLFVGRHVGAWLADRGLEPDLADLAGRAPATFRPFLSQVAAA